MKIWKRNAVIATVLLFVCAGIYLNWSYNQGETTELTETLNSDLLLADETEVLAETDEDALLAAAYEGLEDTASVAEYFAEVRLSRQESRDSAVSTLQEVMSYETGADESAVTSAETALEQVVATALAEAQIESLLVAKGYSDCVAYMTDSGISIAVAAPEEGLNAESVAQIADIVTSQSDYELADIRVIEVN
jgi:stage III sporulation protein AH